MADIVVDKTEWLRNIPEVEQRVQVMLESLITHPDVNAPSIMSVNFIYRAFLQWLLTAQRLGEDPTDVRNSLVAVLNVMVSETASRMVANVDGQSLTARQWAEDVIEEITEGVMEDVSNVDKIRSRKPS